MAFVAIFLGCLGFLAIVSRRSVPGYLIGVHLMSMSLPVLFVFVGKQNQAQESGALAGLLILITCGLSILGASAFAVRAFWVSHGSEMNRMKSLKG